MTNTPPQIVDREAWLQARLAHLEDEKAFTRQRDELSRQRRELPWLEITEDYRLEGSEGEVSLLDLFDGRGQLVVYHFMMGPGWGEGCPSCSYTLSTCHYQNQVPRLRYSQQNHSPHQLQKPRMGQMKQ